MITHPEKMLFPDDGITKGELAAYYETVAPVMLPHISGRPVSLERYPQGIAEEGFFQKNVTRAPEWLQRIEAPKKGGVVLHPLIGDVRSLLWAANQNCITPHVWASRTPNLTRPDICVFDLDPSQDDPAVLRSAALGVRAVLDELALPSWVKTSGSKGFHIVVPLDGRAEFDVAALFAHAVAKVVAMRDREHLTQEFVRADRGGRIFIDVGRNGYSATYAAPYAVRARPGAPVSAPCTWEELEAGDVGPQTFTLRAMVARLEAAGDLWSDLGEHPCSLSKAIEQLRRILGADWTDDPWATQSAARADAMRAGYARRTAARRARAGDDS